MDYRAVSSAPRPVWPPIRRPHSQDADPRLFLMARSVRPPARLLGSASADCSAAVPAGHTVLNIIARRMIVQPWLGQHHVYGSSGTRYGEGVAAEPGHSLLQQYVHARVALWFLVNGVFGDLRRPRNWTLVFVDRSS